MPYNPKIHRRRSIRLKEYDYSQPGMYFVTICVQNKIHLFGQVVNGVMQLNDAGQMVEKWYYELENKFPDIQCREMVVMPNHFHAIIHNVGADLSVCPDRRSNPSNMGEAQNNPNITAETQNKMLNNHETSDVSGEINVSDEPDVSGEIHKSGKPDLLGEHIGSPLASVVQWFKTMSTNEYIRGVKNHNWPRFDGKLWQRNYWEHIIRNEKSYQNIAEYIINNPLKWHKDSLNLDSTDSKAI